MALFLGPSEEWGYFSGREFEVNERIERIF